MNSSLVSSSPDIPCPFSTNLRQKYVKLLISKPLIRFGYFNRQDHLQGSNYDAGKVAVSRPRILGHVQESYIGDKHLEEQAIMKFKFVRTLLIDNYDSYTYNIYQDLSVINGVPPVVVRNDEWTWEYFHHYVYEKKAFDNIVISPGPGSPSCPADIGICLRLFLECKDIPILGVCLGHQALGYVHGARIVHAPEPIHGRLSEIEHTGCNLFHGIPSGSNSGFKVVRYHSLVIDANSIPEELIPIAWTSSGNTLSFLETQEADVVSDAFRSRTDQEFFADYHATNTKNTTSCSSNDPTGMESAKVIMGIVHSTRPHYGVQFHPESIATRHGRQIFENFRKMTVNYWLRSSAFHERKLLRGNQLFKELSTSKLLVNNGDGKNHFSMCNTIGLSHETVATRFLKLKWKKFDRLACQVGGARNIFCELYGDHNAENTFWLDSSSVEQRRARFSFMGGRGGPLWKHVTFRLSDQSEVTVKGGGYLSTQDAQGCVKNAFLEDGFLDFLDKELRSFHYEKKDYKGLPFDFCGGYVGFIGYDLKVECGMPSNRHKSRTPDACFFFADNFLVVDHNSDDVYILSIHDIHHPGNTARLGENPTTRSWLDDTEQKLLSLKASAAKKFKKRLPMPQVLGPHKEGFLAEKSRDQYMKDVEKCLRFIKDGESYELCLTTQMRKTIEDLNFLGLYLSLREKNPAPFAAWLNFSKENLCICCSSPERFLQLDKNGNIEAKPIKGTIARGSTPVKDEQNKLQLLHSEKDQAENLMIVDLLRNDLGRVCEPGSVHVPRLMEVESYASVHTLVSTIRGKKRSNLSPVDCVRAAFPGGSMTGAPKFRSVELLDSIESCSRGIYSGSIGFFSYNQTFDLNIVIRTVVIHEGEASIGAGGAVVAQSNPEDEYNEMILKTRVPAQTVMEYKSELESNYETS